MEMCRDWRWREYVCERVEMSGRCPDVKRAERSRVQRWPTQL